MSKSGDGSSLIGGSKGLQNADNLNDGLVLFHQTNSDAAELNSKVSQ